MVFRSIGQKVNIPLFKYYGNTSYAKDAIENSRIHLEKPIEYNDIYDSGFIIKKNNLNRVYSESFFTDASLKKYYSFLNNDEKETLKTKSLSFWNLIEYLCEKNKGIDKDAFIEDCLLVAQQGGMVIQADNNKISCFSEVNDSLLMWAYYAQNYSGVCVRFNASEDSILSQHCRKVQYTNQFISDNTFGNYFRKSIQWSHEQEWRIVCDTQEEYLSIDSIDAIYLGMRLEKSLTQEFIELGKKLNLDVYKMKISDVKYELLFDQLL